MDIDTGRGRLRHDRYRHKHGQANTNREHEHLPGARLAAPDKAVGKNAGGERHGNADQAGGQAVATDRDAISHRKSGG
ncbi:hypothetical protein, partial [Mesorhizobium sp. M1C.F.Ca.ET.196.01.1.1]|uniref:hypothetical protein n=1 Tax=Mesorhizobium sp. M1C.F.Ca.ET.196.01.1.1 TaxID=2563928 RepID=UPI001FDF33BD